MQKDKKGNRFAERVGWRSNYPLSVLRVTGEDATEFLQGQFSQDIRRVGVRGGAHYGFWLNRKGRVEGDAIIVRGEETCCRVFSWSLQADAIRQRLESFLVADDVELMDETSEWQGWQLAGPHLASWFEDQEKSKRESSLEGALVWPEPIPLEPESFVVVSRSTLAWPSEWEQSEGMIFERLRIGAGRAQVPVDLGPDDMPQEAGLDQVGVSFRKGCYLGQEVMARVQNTGRIRRRLVKVFGSGVVSHDSAPIELWQGQNKIGTLRSRMLVGSGGWIGLAMVNVSSTNFEEPAFLENSDGPELAFAVSP